MWINPHRSGVPNSYTWRTHVFENRGNFSKSFCHFRAKIFRGLPEEQKTFTLVEGLCLGSGLEPHSVIQPNWSMLRYSRMSSMHPSDWNFRSRDLTPIKLLGNANRREQSLEFERPQSGWAYKTRFVAISLQRPENKQWIRSGGQGEIRKVSDFVSELAD